MLARRVLIVGDTLFADALTRILGNHAEVELVGVAPTAKAAQAFITSHPLDALIIAGVGETAPAAFGEFLSQYPDLPILRADLHTNDVQIITSHRVSARSPDLLAALAALPRRNL